MTNLIPQGSQLQQLQDQIKMLREYSQALQAENRTRNQQRIILEKEIDRLSNMQKNNNKNIQQCLECTRYKSDIMKLENQVERLKRQNTNLQSSYNVLSETLSKYNMVNSSTSSKVTTSTTVIASNTKNQWETKYKQLSNKYDEINFQNLGLKKQLQDLTKSMQSQSNTEKVLSKLQEEKQSLNIKISSLELQIHNLKYLLSTKDNQIFTFKSKQTNLLSLQSELKTAKQLVVSKDREVAALRQKTGDLNSLEFELRNLKSSATNKDNEITNLKAQITKNQQQLTKIYKLQSQIRNLKYQITSKDTQIKTLKNRSNEISATQYSKLANIEQELKNTKSALALKDSELMSVKAQLSQQATLRIKITSLENQSKMWRGKYQEQSNHNKVNSSLSVSNAQSLNKIEQLNKELTKLKAECADKDNYTRRVEDELKEMTRRDEEKNIQVKKLDSIVTSYVQKIGELQVELNKLERNSLSGSATTIGLNNQALLIQNRTLNQKIQDLQRRISILEDTNKNLREQLRLSIQMRSRQSSRLLISPTPIIQPIPNVINNDQQLIKTIKQLKSQLDSNKTYNNRIKMDNEYLQAKLSSAQLQIQHLIGLSTKGGIRVVGDRSQGKDHHTMSVLNNNRGLVNMPAVENSKTMYEASFSSSRAPTQPPLRRQFRIQHDYTVLDDNERTPNTSVPDKAINYRSSEPISYKGRQRQTRDQDRQVQVTNIGNTSTSISKNKYPNKLSTGWSKSGGSQPKQLDLLQKRIEMLKQQNKGLRKNLYQPN